ncbi:putative mitochondrial protein [Tanacetum coccineum]
MGAKSWAPAVALLNAVEKKKKKYASICEDNGYKFIPFAFSTFGEFDKDALDTLLRIKSISISHSNNVKSGEFIFHKINKLKDEVKNVAKTSDKGTTFRDGALGVGMKLRSSPKLSTPSPLVSSTTVLLTSPLLSELTNEDRMETLEALGSNVHSIIVLALNILYMATLLEKNGVPFRGFLDGVLLIRKSPSFTRNGRWILDCSKEELTVFRYGLKLHDVPIQVFEEDGISLIATFIEQIRDVVTIVYIHIFLRKFTTETIRMSMNGAARSEKNNYVSRMVDKKKEYGKMNEIFKPYLRKFTLAFFDDIMVYNKSVVEHLMHLKMVLQTMQAHTLFPKRGNYTFAVSQVEYLGHIISDKGVATYLAKIEAMKDWHVPKNVKQLRGFFRLTSYYKRFIKGYAIIRLPNFKKEFNVKNDSCGTGISVVLQQDGHTLAYLSKALSPRHQAMSTYEKEFLAVILALKNQKGYLMDRHFKIKTNHFNLKYLLDQRLTTPFQAKWLPILLGYDYEIAYKKGSENVVVDALSKKKCMDVTLGSCDYVEDKLHMLLEGHKENGETIDQGV